MLIMPIVYRVQNAQGQGPYRVFEDLGLVYNTTWERYPWAEKLHNNGTKTPQPYVDFGYDNCAYYVKHGFLFGFHTLEALHNWFNDRELQLLREWGFEIATIQCNQVYVSKSQKQCVFI